MYDTIHAFCKYENLSVEQLPIYPKLTPTFSQKNGQIIGGETKIRNLNVKFNYINKTASINGSLSRFLFGNNFATPTKRDTERAVKEFCEQIGIPPEKWTLTRVDVATIFNAGATMEIMKNILGDVKRLKRVVYENSIIWKNTNIEMILYDKSMWAKEKGKNAEIPPLLQNSQWLRAELRLLKNIDRRTGKDLNLSRLYNSRFYDNLCEMWLTSFQSIGMKGANTTTTKAPKGVEKSILYYFKKFPDSVDDMIETTSAEINGKQKKSRYRKRMFELKNLSFSADDGTEAKYKNFHSMLSTAKAVH